MKLTTNFCTQMKPLQPLESHKSEAYIGPYQPFTVELFM